MLKANSVASRSRVPTPYVSVLGFSVMVCNRCSMVDVDTAVLAAANGPMKGVINFETQTPVSSGFLGAGFSFSVDAALTVVMDKDLVEVAMW